ncbi:MAG: cation-translocating P-type ATPase, partial [Planctomycetota bacterium]
MSQRARQPGAGRPATIDQPWTRPAGDVLETLGVDPACGLADAEALRRRRVHGPNQLRETGRASSWQVLLNQFKSLIVALLVVAVVVSLVFGQWFEAVAIATVLLVNAAIGFATELRAVRSMEALRRLGTATVRVRRGGRVREIPARELVPGDVVELEAGDVVTADLRLVEASKVEANESTLTGESEPVAKGVEPAATDAPLAERSSVLFRGTAVTRGAGTAVVIATGMATELGRIATLAQEATKAATPLEQRLEMLGRRLIWVTLLITAITIAIGIARGKEALLMVETGIALAVAAIPEGLPIVATLALARGMWRMARHRALINRLSAVETLGATSVILTDKTGTLTENQMTVVRIVLADGDVEIGGGGLETSGHLTADGVEVELARRPDLAAALEIGLLCNNASLGLDAEEAVGIGDPLEVALLVVGAKAELDRAALLARTPERREEAFDPTSRAMATYHARDGGVRVAVKGAPERIVAACRRQLRAAGPAPLGEVDRDSWLRRSAELGDEGMRVVAVAEKTVEDVGAAPYDDLTLVGLVAMLDPPREDVREVLRVCHDAGLRVAMVTGDQAGTAMSIARAVGLAGEGDARVIHGGHLPSVDEMNEADRQQLARELVFARVDPEQKLHLIELHQQAGSVVAMTGDGVNDAPALRKADIGVAMGRRGTQVAREAADMVLQDDSFASIVRAIRQGRVIFANIRRFVVYLLSCNISEVLIVFGASAAGAPLPILPLQILYLNLVTDVFPALALGFGEGDPEVMERPPRNRAEPIMARRHWAAVGLYGVLIGLCVLGAFAIAVKRLGFSDERAVTVSFLALAMAQVWHVFNMRERGSSPLSNDVARSPWV